MAETGFKRSVPFSLVCAKKIYTTLLSAAHKICVKHRFGLDKPSSNACLVLEDSWPDGTQTLIVR